MRSDGVLVAGESPEVVGLDADATLRFAVERRRRAEAERALELKAVTHWCDLHRIDGVDAAGGGVGAVDRTVFAGLLGDPLLGRERELRLAGEGAFAVEEFAVAELAAALGMSETAGRALVGQALELRDRLPRLWAQVHAGAVPAWKALRVAEETIPLTPACAETIDQRLARFAGQLSLRRILAAVHAAILRHDPTLATQQLSARAERRGVWVTHELDGNATFTAVTSTPDADAFDHAVSEVASSLAALGDPRTEQVRRSAALGVLADPQHALDRHTAAHTTAHASEGRPARIRPDATRGTGVAPAMHLHLHFDAITGTLLNGEAGVARVDRYGPRTLAAVQQWLADLAPGTRIILTPVVDLTDRIAVDAHEAPDRLRRQIEERDLVCQFPHCGRQGRFDLDHIDPYQPTTEGGPPGQTSTSNLARLCRFHHRVKTRPGRHGHWRYTRNTDGTLTWTSPLGRHYTVDHNGTRQGP